MQLDKSNIELAAIARELKSAFASQYERVNKRPYKPNKRFDTLDCWLKVAKVVQHLKAVPEEYIRAQFMYALGTVFANTLHGPVAQDRYKKFIRTTGASPVVTNTDTILTSGEVSMFSNCIQQAESILQEQFGPTFRLTEESIKDKVIKREILDSWWRFNPVVIMAFAGKDIEYREKFLLSAANELVESPYLIRAAASLGLDLSNINTDEEELTDNRS